MRLPFRDRPQTWVRPRKSKLVPSVSGCCAFCGLCGLGGPPPPPPGGFPVPTTADYDVSLLSSSLSGQRVNQPTQGRLPPRLQPDAFARPCESSGFPGAPPWRIRGHRWSIDRTSIGQSTERARHRRAFSAELSARHRHACRRVERRIALSEFLVRPCRQPCKEPTAR